MDPTVQEPAGRGPIAPRRRYIDPYRRRCRPSQPSACRKCGAVFRENRWEWRLASAVVNRTLCPACARIADKYPASVLRIHGPVLQKHRAEILALVLNEEKAEAAERPLGRIMDICDRTDEMEIAVTDMPLARRIVSALSAAYGGRARFEYDADHYFLAASWSRDS